ncbi:MAG TPA: NAD(P)-binding domain-containing protein [Thermoplasmata archaeon]
MAGAMKSKPTGTTRPRIGILGTGRVARALATGLIRAGHQVQLGSRQPEKAHTDEADFPRGVPIQTHRGAVEFGDVVILAVPYTAVQDVVATVGPKVFAGKIVIDATNAPYESALGRSTSAAEEIAKIVPAAHVVKAFNTMFARHMATGRLGDEKLLALVAADEQTAKEHALALARDIGFDAVDAGPLSSARYLEAMAIQIMTLAFRLKMGTGIGFKLVRE